MTAFKSLTYVDVSTKHITEADADLLKELADKESPVTVSEYTEGFFVPICGDQGCHTQMVQELVNREASGALIGLLNLLHKEGFHLLRLDADGEVYTDLPSFEW